MKLPSSKFLFYSILIFLLIQVPLGCFSQIWAPPTDNPVELGLVSWKRDYDKALYASSKNGKPIFILFQEVPGCSTCSTYGQKVMSHPLIVEAIETYFNPLCIYNNKGGKDAQVLVKYKEPTWNNPVVRITDSTGKDIHPRVAGVYNEKAVIDAIIQVLHKEREEIPEYLTLLQTELNQDYTEKLTLSMYCFWSGEKAMATIPGIKETTAGFMNGREVVQIEFNPTEITEKEIINRARKVNCADEVYSDKNSKYDIPVRGLNHFRKDPETKYYLYNSPYRSVPMTPFQELKVNYELSQGGDPTYLLSPRQLAVYQANSAKGKNPNLIGMSINKSWSKL